MCIRDRAYAVLNPNAEIEIQQSDSTTCIQSAIDGVCDIGMASRDLKDSELVAGLTGTTIAMDGIAIIVNPANPVDSMTCLLYTSTGRWPSDRASPAPPATPAGPRTACASKE